MTTTTQYVRVDEHGVMRVADSRVMLDSVIAGFEQGLSAETIQQQYPAIRLEEVYGAIAYYLGHLDEVTQYLGRQQQLWDEERGMVDKQSGGIAERLRALRSGPSSETP